MKTTIAKITKHRCACGWSGDVFLHPGESVPCPECGAETESTRHFALKAHAIAVDEIPGGMVLENYGPHPVKVYSHTERKALMLKNGLELTERFSPMPGTDIDPAGIPNPKGYIDAQTLDNAKILLSRPATRRDEEPDHVGNIRLDLGESFNEVLQPVEVQKLRRSLG